MIEGVPLEKIKSMSAEERLELARKALWSEEHMLKVIVKIMLIIDPSSAEDIMDWFKSRVS